jgi:hypothetical protein
MGVSENNILACLYTDGKVLSDDFLMHAFDLFQCITWINYDRPKWKDVL